MTVLNRIVVRAKPIYNLFAIRNELGRSRKITIYASKVLIGFIVAALLVLPFDGVVRYMAWASVAVFITSKVCYYVNTRTLPTGFDDVSDWFCDGVLHLTWLIVWLFRHHDRPQAWLMIIVFLATYPWSSE